MLSGRWTWFTWRVFNYVLVTEFCFLSVLFLAYLGCLNQKLNAIENESFQNEKKALLISTTAFLATYLLYTALTLVFTFFEEARFGAGFFITLLIEMSVTLLCELVPLFVIQVQHATNRSSIENNAGSMVATEERVTFLDLAELKSLRDATAIQIPRNTRVGNGDLAIPLTDTASSHITFTVPSDSSRASPSISDKKQRRRDLLWNTELLPHENEEAPNMMVGNLQNSHNSSNTVDGANLRLDHATGDFPPRNTLHDSRDYRIALHMLVIDGLEAQRIVTSIITSSSEVNVNTIVST